MKNLIVFHYHFLPGGVTDVVTSAVAAYLQHSQKIESITLVSGRQENLQNVTEIILRNIPEERKSHIKTEVFESIDYMEKIGDDINQAQLVKDLQEKYGHEDNLWWIHNYHLGKNPFFTGALLEISETSNQKMVFHIHDFPECSRYPLLQRLRKYVKRDLYTQSQNVRYALINSRDYKNLQEAGIPESRLFLLENPLNTTDKKYTPSAETEEKLVSYFRENFPRWKKQDGYMLYPVRAIRRKNIAEAALLALLTDHNLIITLPGVSDMEKSYSSRCRSIFTEGLVPGMFGIGREMEKAGISFDELIASSGLILSSSVQEGFGYLFLNSINWGKSLLSRDLDMLDSFRPAFEDYDAHFYSTVKIKAEWIDCRELKNLYRSKINELEEFLPEGLRQRILDQVDDLLDEMYIDYSYLPLSMQIDVLKKLNKSQQLMKECKEANKSIANIVEKFYFSDCGQRKEVLSKGWSFKSYNESTEEILHSFTQKDPLLKHKTPINPIFETLLANFATPPYLRLIYDE